MAYSHLGATKSRTAVRIESMTKSATTVLRLEVLYSGSNVVLSPKTKAESHPPRP